jgi:hypothetical protein
MIEESDDHYHQSRVGFASVPPPQLRFRYTDQRAIEEGWTVYLDNSGSQELAGLLQEVIPSEQARMLWSQAEISS